jgi:microcystin-dependent protein
MAMGGGLFKARYGTVRRSNHAGRFNFAPVRWAVCGGQLLSISQNSALFSLLGAHFGGDGRTTFALPNLQGRVIIGAGRSTGSTFQIGEVGGQESVTITQTEMPAHTHTATFTPSGGGSAASRIYTPTGYTGATAVRSAVSWSTGARPTTSKTWT